MLAMISSEVHSSHSKAALLPCSALDELFFLSQKRALPADLLFCKKEKRKRGGNERVQKKKMF